MLYCTKTYKFQSYAGLLLSFQRNQQNDKKYILVIIKNKLLGDIDL